MDALVTGAVIRQQREARGLTQDDLAAQIGVTGKAVSRWETGIGFPDIALLEPLSAALGLSVAELLRGEPICNRNRSFQMLKTKFYVCPLCGNILYGSGDALVSCCGLTLPPLEAEETDEAHRIRVEAVEDEAFVSVAHDMTKTHYLSFLAFVTCDRVQLVKLYPEGNAETRLPLRGRGVLYTYCNRHGLMKQPFSRR